jgi:uncharacterized protein (DUF3820 family)
MDTTITLPFGAHRGKRLCDAPQDYILWLADPKRLEYAAQTGKGFPQSILETAQSMKAGIIAAIDEKQLAEAYLGGKTHDGPAPIYVIECDGDMHSESGTFAFDHKVCPTLDAAFDCLKAEYPKIGGTDEDPETADAYRESPDPEDDKIIIWEILPSGHRKAIWGFFGWHWSADDYACGQGTLPGDPDSLYDIASLK